MSDKPEPLDGDSPSFASLMDGVERHHHDRADTGRPARHAREGLAYTRDAAVREPEKVIDGLSVEAVDIVESGEELLFAAPGVQLRVMKRLRQGHIPWEAGIDLHGMTVDEARDQLGAFIHDARRRRSRAVLVVHGKGYSQAGRQPVLKSCVNDWLRRLPDVLAFCSAQPRDGGTGALYVLLKRPV